MNNATPHRFPPCLSALIVITIGLWVCQAVAYETSNLSTAGSLPTTGKGLYESACMACHGVNGTGETPARVGFSTPLPDFTDCSFASREGNEDWISVVAEGGPGRAFSTIMPAFGDALTDEQIVKILDHIRDFCVDKEWPRGELNLPRALFTTKAFPEDELVLTSELKTAGNDVIYNKLIYEQGIGARNQIEVALPFGWRQYDQMGGPQKTEWESSIGDIAPSVPVQHSTGPFKIQVQLW